MVKFFFFCEWGRFFFVTYCGWIFFSSKTPYPPEIKWCAPYTSFHNIRKSNSVRIMIYYSKFYTSFHKIKKSNNVRILIHPKQDFNSYQYLEWLQTRPGQDTVKMCFTFIILVSVCYCSTKNKCLWKVQTCLHTNGVSDTLGDIQFSAGTSPLLYLGTMTHPCLHLRSPGHRILHHFRVI